MDIEISTTLADGLPCIARGIYYQGSPASYCRHIGTWDPPEPECVEDIEVFWPKPSRAGKLYPMRKELTSADMEKLEQDLLDHISWSLF